MWESKGTRGQLRSAIPEHLTRFIGRARELVELERLITTTRLLTLTGPGGIGKSRLAAAVAQRRGPLAPAGWIDLSPLQDTELLAEQIGYALGVPERSGLVTIAASLDSAAAGSMLLVLDNCEHLLPACASFVEVLLRATTGVTILATSRAPLGLAGERTWVVPQLPLGEAVELFVERAQAAAPTFEVERRRTTVESICQRLDGNPLAIELAAARTRALAPEQIERRLSNAFQLLSGGIRTSVARHRTLRATMEWSHGLLNEREQVLFRRLAVFAGSFSLPAAEAVCAGGRLDDDDILNGIASLVDQSLVMIDSGDGEARYSVQETVRQYAQERLTEAAEHAELRERHANYFLSLAEEAEPFLFWGGEPHWVRRVGAEIDNFRAVVTATTDGPQTPVALRIATAIHWYWFATGQLREGRQHLVTLLARCAGHPTALRGQALVASANLAFWQGDLLAARQAGQEALVTVRITGGGPSLAYCLAVLGAIDCSSREPAIGTTHLAEAETILATNPIESLMAFVAYWKGRAAAAAGDLAAARKAFEDAARIGRQLGHRPAIAHAQGMLAWTALRQGHYDVAARDFAESITLHREGGDGWGLANGLDGMAAVAMATGRPERAVRLYAAAAATWQRVGSELPVAGEREHDLRACQQALGDRFALAWQRGLDLSSDEAVELATSDSIVLTGEIATPNVDRPVLGSRRGLQVRALGAFQVQLGSEPIDPAAWGSARVRELLVYLLLGGPAGRTKDEVGAALWPEASASQVRNSFHVTLYRLRKALGGADWILQVADRYRIDPTVRVDFDVDHFRIELAAARTTLGRGQDGAVAMERALAWYRGDLLDGEPVGDWRESDREQLRELFVEGAVALARHHLQTGRGAKASEFYRRALLRDPFREEVWRELMICHARLGERALATRLYHQMARQLASELGGRPAPETVAVFERIQAGESP